MRGYYNPISIRSVGKAESIIDSGEVVVEGASSGYVKANTTENAVNILGISFSTYKAGDTVAVTEIGEAIVKLSSTSSDVVKGQSMAASVNGVKALELDDTCIGYAKESGKAGNIIVVDITREYSLATGGSGDIVPPNDATSFTATGASTSADLTWTDSTSPDIDHYELRWYTGSIGGTLEGSDLAVATGGSYTVTPLSAGVTYYFELKAVDSNGNTSTGVTDSAVPTA